MGFTAAGIAIAVIGGGLSASNADRQNRANLASAGAQQTQQMNAQLLARQQEDNANSNALTAMYLGNIGQVNNQGVAITGAVTTGIVSNSPGGTNRGPGTGNAGY